MFSTTVITLKNILISEFMMIVAFALHIIPEFHFMKVDYVFLINATSMFLNLVDQIHDTR